MGKMAEGNYLGKLVGAHVGSNKKNKPQAQLEFLIDHRSVDGRWDPIAPPVKRSLYIYLTPDALPYAEKKFVIMGFNGNYRSMKFDPKWTEKSSVLVCKYEGDKNFETWDLQEFIDSYGSSSMDDLPDNDLDRLAARFSKNQEASQAPGAPIGAPPTEETYQADDSQPESQEEATEPTEPPEGSEDEELPNSDDDTY